MLLSEHADGELGPLRRWRVEAHLAACDGCRAVYRALLETVQILRVLGSVEPEGRPKLVESVRRRIEPGA